MTAKQFYDWQTSGGTDDVMRLVACLESNDIPWCAIGGVAVKILAWSDTSRRQSKRIKDFADIARLVESHPSLWDRLSPELREQVERP